MEWREPALREMPIPLRPRGRFFVGQVERVDDAATLPAAVIRRVRPKLGIGAVRCVT